MMIRQKSIYLNGIKTPLLRPYQYYTVEPLHPQAQRIQSVAVQHLLSVESSLDIQVGYPESSYICLVANAPLL